MYMLAENVFLAIFPQSRDFAAQNGNWTALIHGAKYGHAECVRLLLRAGANKNVRVGRCLEPSFHSSRRTVFNRVLRRGFIELSDRRNGFIESRQVCVYITKSFMRLFTCWLRILLF